MRTHLKSCFLLRFDTVTISWLLWWVTYSRGKIFQTKSSNWVRRNTEDIYHAKFKDESFYLRIIYIFIPIHGFACATYFQVCRSCNTSVFLHWQVQFSWSFFCDYFTAQLKILPHLSTISSPPTLLAKLQMSFLSTESKLNSWNMEYEFRRVTSNSQEQE